MQVLVKCNNCAHLRNKIKAFELLYDMEDVHVYVRAPFGQFTSPNGEPVFLSRFAPVKRVGLKRMIVEVDAKDVPLHTTGAFDVVLSTEEL